MTVAVGAGDADKLPKKIIPDNIPTSVLEMISETIAHMYQFMPIAFEDGELTVAIEEGADKTVFIDELRFLLNVQVKPVYAPQDQIAAAIAKYYPESAKPNQEIIIEPTDIFPNEPIRLSLSDVCIREDVLKMVPPVFASLHKCIPVGYDDSKRILTVAVGDGTDYEQLKVLSGDLERLLGGVTVVTKFALAAEIEGAIERNYKN
jgi:hypothetical protein